MSSIKLKDVCSNMFVCNGGLKQGDSLSPILFSFYINDLISRISKEASSTVIDILLYADDLVILGDSRESLLIKIDRLTVLKKYLSVTKGRL